MKTRQLLLALAGSVAMQMAQAQQPYWNSLPGGNVITTTEWLGADFGSLIPLRIQTRANQPIDFSTANLFRARINPKASYPLNTFPNIQADGFTLITPDDGFLSQVRGPFSRLHLAEGGQSGNAEQWGYRPWQRNGVTFTGNGDQGYIGQKYNEDNLTDMVIQWSDNPGNWKGDRLRFLFTSGYNGASTGMNSEEGLEGMRLFPTVEQGINVGVGDFFAYGGDPTERLHVRDGRVRIQQLPTDPIASTLTKFLVVDDVDPTSDEYGVVKWRYLPTVPPPAASCDWSLNPTTHNNVSTAYNTTLSSTCPDETDAVGIGLNLLGSAAAAKLHVRNNTSIASMTDGIDLDVTPPGARVFPECLCPFRLRRFRPPQSSADHVAPCSWPEAAVERALGKQPSAGPVPGLW